MRSNFELNKEENLKSEKNTNNAECTAAARTLQGGFYSFTYLLLQTQITYLNLHLINELITYHTKYFK